MLVEITRFASRQVSKMMTTDRSLPSATNIKISIICSSEETLAALNAAHVNRPGINVFSHADSLQTLTSVLRRDLPDVAVLELPFTDEGSMEQVEAALLKSPGTHMVLVSPDRSVEFLMRAMRAGVREVLPSPLNAETVQQVVMQAQGHHAISRRHREAYGKVLAVIPSKGGAGSTFLACNLAHALSLQDKRVALLDLNLYFGDAAMFLGDGNVTASIVDLAHQIDRLDSALLESSMIRINDNLHVLAAPESPEEVNDVSVTRLEQIIEIARSHYDFVVLDVSSTLDSVAVKALDLADTVFLTLQLNLPFIRAAKRMVSVFRVLGYTGEKLRVVVNRYEKDGTISLTDVEKATMLKIGRNIPNNHRTVSSSINQGIPVIQLASRDPVARALRDWAQEIAPGTEQHSEGWFQDLMKFVS